MTPPKLLKNCRREGGEKTWLRVALRQPLVGEYAIFSLIPFRLGWMRELEAFTLPDWFMFSSAGGGDESIGRTEPDESWCDRRLPHVACRDSKTAQTCPSSSAHISLIPFRLGWMREPADFTLPVSLSWSPAEGSCPQKLPFGAPSAIVLPGGANRAVW